MNYISIFHIFKSRNNLAISMKNLNSILKAHPVFNHEAGYAPHLRETHGLALFSLMFFPFLPQESGPEASSQGPEQPWKVTRLRRVLVPGLKVGVRQASLHGVFKTNTGTSCQQGAHDRASRSKHHDATWKSLDHGHRRPDKYPAMHAPFFYSHSHPCLHLP